MRIMMRFLLAFALAGVIMTAVAVAMVGWPS